MNHSIRLRSLALLVFILSSATVFAADAPSRPKRAASPKASATSAPPASVSAPEARPEPAKPLSKVVRYGREDVAVVETKLRYTTLIVLPPAERILDFTVGDKDYWIVEGTESFAYIKPAKAGARTNLNLVTASGNIYSFLLTEVSEVPDAQPDLKVFVEPTEDPMLKAPKGAPRFVSAAEVEDFRQQALDAKEETREVKRAAQTAIDSGVAKFIANVRFPYRFEAGKAPFNVRAMYRDDKFTFIQARPEETPTLYELRDGKPNLVNFDYKDGVYVTDRIIGRGYLAIGKKKLAFTSED